MQLEQISQQEMSDFNMMIQGNLNQRVLEKTQEYNFNFEQGSPMLEDECKAPHMSWSLVSNQLPSKKAKISLPQNSMKMEESVKRCSRPSLLDGTASTAMCSEISDMFMGRRTSLFQEAFLSSRESEPMHFELIQEEQQDDSNSENQFERADS
eukprot:CAMPEP_0176376404 /NCGR_PEP_ID=MMETSP0126-20121128/28173_1 /TAXON_ID=141414 ORGANISM="Strombidinopsis acuminatum, Strain SPMC142" /NCGR_SAMPLE_ID=MMETSP0126 /ASSEMBLY_ACC=CAM_ASM_000229 /LENGTH=152 /DNA_ID=CAMNT_0017737845 /DNA_START=216 /DNA_END=674 /DNA_ORIENTATION=-